VEKSLDKKKLICNCVHIRVKNKGDYRMRKAKQASFFKKTSDYASKKLAYLMEVENWENQELSEKSGIPQNRLSEIKNQKRAMTELWLKALITGGIIAVDDIDKSVPLDNEEKKYLNEMRFFENKALIESIKNAINEGIDPGMLKEIIDKTRKKNKDKE
jgi:hypothetical protein